MRPGARSRSPRQAMSPSVTATTRPKKLRSQIPMSPSLKAWTDSITPERVRNVPRMVRLKVAQSRERFQTRSIPRRSCTITECRYAVPVSHGSREDRKSGVEGKSVDERVDLGGRGIVEKKNRKQKT